MVCKVVGAFIVVFVEAAVKIYTLKSHFLHLLNFRYSQMSAHVKKKKCGHFEKSCESHIITFLFMNCRFVIT